MHSQTPTIGKTLHRCCKRFRNKGVGPHVGFTTQRVEAFVHK